MKLRDAGAYLLARLRLLEGGEDGGFECFGHFEFVGSHADVAGLAVDAQIDRLDVGLGGFKIAHREVDLGPAAQVDDPDLFGLPVYLLSAPGSNRAHPSRTNIRALIMP